MKRYFAVLMLIAVTSLSARTAISQSNPPEQKAAPVQMDPSPRLEFTGAEQFRAGDHSYIRYHFRIANWQDYDDQLFAAAPGLPPCGRNTTSARTWVSLRSNTGASLYGFCAFEKAEHLRSIWFSVKSGSVPPPTVHAVLHDREFNHVYRSNEVRLSGPEPVLKLKRKEPGKNPH